LAIASFITLEPRIERVEHRAAHRHAVMRLEHRRRIGEHHRDRVAALDAALRQGRAEPAGARVELGVAAPEHAVNDRGVVGIDRGGAVDQRQRGQRLEIRRIAVEIGVVG
jgi:hypothetical protein